MIMEQMAVVVSVGIPERGNSREVQGLSPRTRSSVMLIMAGEWILLYLSVLRNVVGMGVFPVPQHSLAVCKPLLWQTETSCLPLASLMARTVKKPEGLAVVLILPASILDAASLG